MRPGFFDHVSCFASDPNKAQGATESKATSLPEQDAPKLVCTLVPQKQVKSFSFSGHIPFVLLHEDLKRRVFLRPGSRIEAGSDALDRQAERLRAYLVGEGYYDAAVAVSQREVPGDDANIDVHLDIAISARKTVLLRQVKVVGDIPMPIEALTQPLYHHWFLAVPARFRPVMLADDVQAITDALKHRGWAGAHVNAQPTYALDEGAVDIVLSIRSGKRATVELLGDGAMSKRQLKRLLPFNEANAVDAVAIDTLRDRLLRFFQERGHADVTVEIQTQNVAPKNIHVSCIITKGPRYHVSQLRFVGNRHIAAQALINTSKLLQKASSRLFKKPFVDAYVAHDVQALLATLKQAGFAQAQITAERDAPLGKSASDGSVSRPLEVTYTIIEGPQLHVAEVDWMGLPHNIDNTSLKKKMKLQPGLPFIAGSAEADVQTLETEMAAEGYLEAKVTPELRLVGDDELMGEANILGDEAKPVQTQDNAPQAATAVANKGISVVMRIDKGTQARVGGVLTRGNFRTRASTLKDELGVFVGQPLNLPALGAARRALRGLNLFDSVALSFEPRFVGDGRPWLLLGVEERQVRSLDGVLSFSSDFGPSVGADLKDRNLLGRAITLSLGLRLSNASEALGPRLRFGNQDLLELQLRAQKPFRLPFDAEALAQYRYQDVEEYRDSRVGGQLAISRLILTRNIGPWAADLRIRLGYELSRALHVDKLNGGGVPQQSEDPNTIARLIPGISIDRRDSPVDPRVGLSGDVRVDIGQPILAGPFARTATAFWRLLLAWQGYVPMGTPPLLEISDKRVFGGPLVLALAANYAAAGPLGPDGRVPDSETFGYGGDMSVRGLVSRASSRQLDRALYMATGTVEVRWYAMSNLGFGTLQLAGFVDVGTVAKSLSGLFMQSTLSVGPAVRYVTPVGPLSVAYGRTLILPEALRQSPDAAPHWGRVHVTFGYTF